MGAAEASDKWIDARPVHTISGHSLWDEAIDARDRFARVMREKLEHDFPGISPTQWNAKLRMFMHENSYLLVRNDHAVALARVQRDEFSNDPFVVPIFVLRDDTDRARDDAFALCKEVVRWAKTLQASEVRFGDHVRVTPERLISKLDGDERKTIVVKTK